MELNISPCIFGIIDCFIVQKIIQCILSLKDQYFLLKIMDFLIQAKISKLFCVSCSPCYWLSSIMLPSCHNKMEDEKHSRLLHRYMYAWTLLAYIYLN